MTTIPSVRPRKSLGYRFSLTMKRDWQLWVLLIPALAFFIVFCYFPMYGAQIAFRNYKAAFGVTGSPWVGWANFEKFFKLYYCGRMFANTFLLNFHKNPDYGFPARPKAKFAAALNKAQHDNIVVVGFSIDAAERIKVHIFNYDFDVTSEQYGDTIPPVATIALSTFKGSFDNLKVPTKE